MARRRRRKSTSKWHLIVLAILVTAFATVLLVKSGAFDPHRTMARLDIRGYQESPLSYSGNFYVVEGAITERLAQSPAGTVYAVSSDGLPLAIVVPQNVWPSFNIQRGQHLLFEIRIAEDGSAIANSITKK